jgi:hypothetical protein
VYLAEVIQTAKTALIRSEQLFSLGGSLSGLLSLLDGLFGPLPLLFRPLQQRRDNDPISS